MKKLLVTGYMRSGTTFLANLLNSQEGALVYRDFLVSLFRTSINIGIDHLTQPLSDEQRNILLSSLKAEGSAIHGQIFDDLPSNFENIRDVYYHALAAMDPGGESEVVGTKVTMLGSWLPQITDLTDVKVVYIYRDMRDVLLSARNRFETYSLLKFMRGVEEEIEGALSINSENLCMIRFEDLIHEPSATCEVLSSFLDMEISPKVSMAKDRSSPWRDNSSFHDVKQMFDPAACERWKKSRDADEVVYPSILKASFLCKLGYEVDDHHGPGVRLKTWSRYLPSRLIYNPDLQRAGKRLLQRLV